MPELGTGLDGYSLLQFHRTRYASLLSTSGSAFALHKVACPRLSGLSDLVQGNLLMRRCCFSRPLVDWALGPSDCVQGAFKSIDC